MLSMSTFLCQISKAASEIAHILQYIVGEKKYVTKEVCLISEYSAGKKSPNDQLLPLTSC